MATTKKPDSERPRSAGREGVCPGCTDRFGKKKAAPQLLRSLLCTHVRTRYDSRNQGGVAGTESNSSGHPGPTTRAALAHARRFDADTRAIGHTQETRRQTQEEERKTAQEVLISYLASAQS